MRFALYRRIIAAIQANHHRKTASITRFSRIFSNLSGYLVPAWVVVLFIVLWLKSQAIDFNQHNRYVIHLRHTQELDARISQNVLQARYGHLTYYDPIVNDLAALKKLQTNLKQTPTFIDQDRREELSQLLQTYIKDWQEKEQWIQRFQSQNAILRNSLTYFPLAIADLVEKDTTAPTLATHLTTLLRTMLLFNIATDKELVAQINREMQQIIADPIANADDAELKNALAHARIILNSRPQVNDLVETIMALPTTQRSESLAQAYDRSYEQALNTSNTYRFWLYLLSIILLFSVATWIILRLKASAAAIQKAEEKYRSIFENSVSGIFQTTPDGRYISANPMLAEIYGYESIQELRLNLTDIDRQLYVLPERRRELIRLIEEKGSVADFESQVYRKDGTAIWISENARKVCDRSGKLLYYEGTVTDITARKQVEEALQASEAELRLLFAAMTDIIIVFDSSGHCLKYIYTQSLAYKPDVSRVGKTVHEILPKEIADIFIDAIRRALDLYDPSSNILDEIENRPFNQPSIFVEYWLPIRDRKTWLSASVTALSENTVLWVARDITQLKQAEAAIKESEQKYRHLVETSMDIIWSVDKEGRLTFVNRAVKQILGYEPGEMIGRPFTDFYYSPEKVTEGCEVFQHVLAGESFFHVEHTCRAKNGNPVYLMFNVDGVRDREGKVIGATGTATDITGRVQAEEALRASEAKFASAFLSSPLPLAIARLKDRCFIEVNDSFCRYTGRTHEEIIGHTAFELNLFKHPAEPGKIIQTLEETGAIRNREIEVCSKSGEVKTALFSAEVVNLNGQACTLSVTNDITDRKRVEAALQRSEAKFRNLFENSQVGIFRTRLEDGLIMAANQRFIAMMGYDSAAEVIGIKRSVELYVDPNERLRLIETVGTNREIHNFETQFRRRDGSVFWALFSGRWNTEEGYLEGVMSDISDRKLAEAALQQAVEAAQVANRAKSQFLSNMSHELRTPLNVILGFTQLMTRNGSLTPIQQGYLETISRSGEHLLTLINDVLEMSKIEAGKVTLNENSFNLYDLLASLHAMLRLKAESKGLQLLFDISSDLPHYVRTDESKLRQVLMNLLGNAIKFTQAGSVTLRVKMEEWERGGVGEGERGRWGDGEMGRWGDKEVSPYSLLPTPYSLLFEVEDTGPGIAPQEINTLFQAFVQTETGRNSQEGTGLGLPISQKFVRLMGGEITVDSKLGEGTVFKFDILCSAVEPNELHAQKPSRQVVGLEAGQPNYRILVVEDKQENRQLMLELLTPVGFEVREAINGQEAIDLWKSWSPHLIWMDIRMPVMDGFEATKQIKAGGTQAPVIIALTGSAFEEDRIAALSIGCDDFVRKPFRAEVIFEKMTEHLGVRYLYGSPQLPSQSTEKLSISTQQSILQMDELREALAQMPVEWVEQLHQAATKVNSRQILQLVEQIPQANAHLVSALTELVNNFCFEEIVASTQK